MNGMSTHSITDGKCWDDEPIKLSLNLLDLDLIKLSLVHALKILEKARRGRLFEESPPEPRRRIGIIVGIRNNKLCDCGPLEMLHHILLFGDGASW